ncbi:cytochrome c oxidase assembly protein CtaG/Cox11-domain-containing protein [Amylocystis lapponica]|nr:cytochrome c oxidase assembly protein CtaG/Cox11-domain-containing protein [Amylocystis lapponica]
MSNRAPLLPASAIKTPQHASRQQVYAARNRSLLMYTSAVIVMAVGVTYAAVPLYRMFCAATGFAGTPKVGMGKYEAERLVPVESAKRIKVHFNADTSDALPWTVLPGETSLAFYKARNTSKNDIIGIATYNVTPDRIAPYFAKVECFCFEEQKLLAGEEVDMPLLFFIDKDVLDDPACRASQGFGDYEMAPRVENRKEGTKIVVNDTLLPQCICVVGLCIASGT